MLGSRFFLLLFLAVSPASMALGQAPPRTIPTPAQVGAPTDKLSMFEFALELIAYETGRPETAALIGATMQQAAALIAPGSTPGELIQTALKEAVGKLAQPDFVESTQQQLMYQLKSEQTGSLKRQELVKGLQDLAAPGVAKAAKDASRQLGQMQGVVDTLANAEFTRDDLEFVKRFLDTQNGESVFNLYSNFKQYLHARTRRQAGEEPAMMPLGGNDAAMPPIDAQTGAAPGGMPPPAANDPSAMPPTAGAVPPGGDANATPTAPADAAATNKSEESTLSKIITTVDYAAKMFGLFDEMFKPLGIPLKLICEPCAIVWGLGRTALCVYNNKYAVQNLGLNMETFDLAWCSINLMSVVAGGGTAALALDTLKRTVVAAAPGVMDFMSSNTSMTLWGNETATDIGWGTFWGGNETTTTAAPVVPQQPVAPGAPPAVQQPVQPVQQPATNADNQLLVQPVAGQQPNSGQLLVKPNKVPTVQHANGIAITSFH